MPMYMPGQACAKTTAGGLWCFSERSNNELPTFSLGCSNTAFLEGKPICLPMEINARVFEEQQAQLREELRRAAEKARATMRARSVEPPK
jgi:hypothetical protein